MGKHRSFSPEYKIKSVRCVLEEHLSQWEVSREYKIARGVLQRWIKHYQEYGESYFYEEHRGKGGGNHFAALHTSKSLSREERLELENLKLRIENERLKKGYIVKGVGANKGYVTTLDVNTKSSKS